MKQRGSLRRDYTILSGYCSAKNNSMIMHKSSMLANRRTAGKQGSIPVHSRDDLAFDSSLYLPEPANQSHLLPHDTSGPNSNIFERERTLQRQAQSNQLMMLSTSTMKAMMLQGSRLNQLGAQ